MYSNHKQLAWFMKTASSTLTVFLLLSSFATTTFADLSGADLNYTPRYETHGYSNNYKVSGHDGSYTHSYKIEVPQGITNHTPDISLEYSSANPSDHDLTGYGWSLSIPEISRQNKTGIQDLYENDTYVSSLSGELVRVSSTEYQAKIETGDFYKYELENDVWTVTAKDGLVYSFGSSTSERQDDPDDSSNIFKWMLTSVVDKNGNEIIYTYSKDQNQIYPDTVTYANGKFQIDFDYESRNHELTSYRTLFSVTTDDRLANIEVLNGSTTIREYDLDYETGDNGVRNVLKSITETGYVSGVAQTKPATIFTYEKFGSSDVYASNPDYEYGANSELQIQDILPEDVGYGYDKGARYVDLNGDGLTDVIKFFKVTEQDDTPYYSWTDQKVHIATGTAGWEYDVSWDWGGAPLPFSSRSDGVWSSFTQSYDMGARMVDVNGDGKSDYVVGYVDESTATETKGVYLNTGSGFEYTNDWSIPTGFVGRLHLSNGYHYRSSASEAFVDINADGLIDLIYAYVDDKYNYTDPYWATSTIEHRVYINTGYNWELDNDFELPPNFYIGEKHYNPLDYGARFADLNNDGLVDIAKGYDDIDTSSPNNEWYEYSENYINKGLAFATNTTSHPAPTYSTDSPYAPNAGYRYFDVNGDGVIDLTRAKDIDDIGAEQIRYIHINDGDSVESYLYEKCCSFPTVTDIRYPIDINVWWRFGNPNKNPAHLIFDYDGDGLDDIINGEDLGLSSTTEMHGIAYLQPSKVKDLLISVTNPLGGVTDIEYQGFREQADNDPTVFGNAIANPQVVTKITKTSEPGMSYEETYRYQNGSYYYRSDDVHDRRFAGFGKVIKTTDMGKEITYYHQGDDVSTTTEEGVDGKSLIGRMYRSEVADLNDNLYTLTRYNYATSSLGASSTFVILESEVTLDYDGDIDERASAVSYTYDSNHGSILTQTEWGEVDADTDGTFSDTGSDDRKTIYEYATSSDVAFVSNRILEDETDTKVAESRFYYDNQSLGNVTVGNLTKREDWVLGSNYVDTEWTYDSYGNILSEADPRGYTTNYEYDTYNLYLSSTTNSVGHNTQYEYDYSSGQIATTTNPNGEVFVSVYDGFGRLLEEYIPDPQSGSRVLISEYSYMDTAGAASIQKTDHLSGSIERNTYTYLNGFGQTVQTRSEAEESNEYIVRDFVYGDSGLLEKESLPYFSTGSAETTITTEGDLFSNYSYDTLNRVVTVSTAVGTTTTSYDQWQETVTDTEGNEKAFAYDAFSRLITVIEEEGVSTYDTDYDWDANDNLIKITDAENNVRNITYDGLNRRTSLEDLHDTADSTFGVWSLAYDANGNLASTSDPKNQVVNYMYDSINRVLTEDYTGTAYTDITYEYDSCTNGVGQLCSVVNESATTTFTYTPNNLIETETRTIAGTTYTTEYEYDWQGNQMLITYPDDSEVRYTYNKGNQIELIEQREDGGSFVDVIKDIDYGPHGMVTLQVFANGATTTKEYDELELYRLRSIVTTATSTAGVGGPGPELVELGSELGHMAIVNETSETSVEESEREPLFSDDRVTSTEVTEDGESVELVQPSVLESASSNSSSEETVQNIEEAVASSSTASSTLEVEGSEGSIVSESSEMETIVGESNASSTEVNSEVEMVKSNNESELTRSRTVWSNEPAQLKDKSSTEKATIKGVQIADALKERHAYDRDDTRIEVVETNPIEGGVEIYARVYRDGEQIGFGLDGTVDIERFRIFNPPILVPDTSGEVVVEYYSEITEKTTVEKYREDPEEAALMVIKSNLDLMKNVHSDEKVIRNKRGKTVSTFYSDANPESTTFDGKVLQKSDTPSWSEVRSATTGSIIDDYNPQQALQGEYVSSISRYQIARLLFLFDTAPIGTDDISSATLSLYYNSSQGSNQSESTYPANFALVSSNPASSTVLAYDDYDDFGSTRLASDVTMSSFVNNGYGDFSLNSSGLSSIDTDGISKFGIRPSNDFSDSTAPTARSYVYVYNAESSGTTNDPKLVIEHNAVSSSSSTSTADVILDLEYEYDSVGNIVNTVDTLAFGVVATTTYEYDDLYRLAFASSTKSGTTTGNFFRTYTYSAIGNMLNKSDVGSSTYAEIGYANPHAVTNIIATMQMEISLHLRMER